MKDYEKYYEANLYPIQDGVLNIVKELKTPFYLTGGTALSRYYFGHRYSDDLDFFINGSHNYRALTTDIISELHNKLPELGLELETSGIVENEKFTSFYVKQNQRNSADEINLKIDIVNDIPYRVGLPVTDPKFGPVDNWENILTNKVGALFRFAGKDYSDIWILSRNKKFNWGEVLKQAKEKDWGADPSIIHDIVSDIPLSVLKAVIWKIDIDINVVKEELKKISRDILYGADNSLCTT